MYQNTNQVIIDISTECCVVLFVFIFWCFCFLLYYRHVNYLFVVFIAKGRTSYELHPESYALRDGVAQTMTLFKPRLVTVHRPTCLFHQQQLAAAGASKQSPVTTPNRVNFIIIIY